MKNLFVGVKNVLLWSYERGSWQYDVLCLLIIAALFLIPSRYFGDRDRTPPQAKRRATTQANDPLPTASNPAASSGSGSGSGSGSDSGSGSGSDSGSNANAGSGGSEVTGEPEIVWSEDLRAFLARRNQPADRAIPSEEAIVLYMYDRHRREVVLARAPELFSDAAGKAGYRVWYRVK